LSPGYDVIAALADTVEGRQITSNRLMFDALQRRPPAEHRLTAYPFHLSITTMNLPVRRGFTR
jgi:hypothetical protein